VTLPSLEPWQWLLGGVCAFLVGVAKTGVPGLGILIVPLMILTVRDARHAAGWVLPLLCAADVLAVRIYRRHAAVGRLFSLAPWVLVGMGAGAVALAAPERFLRRLVGAIVLAMVALHAARRRRADAAAAADGRDSRLPAAAYGAVAGFATTVANAAGPVMNAYLLSKRLPKAEFVATGAWFFLVINLAKVPVYGYHHLIDARSLAFDAVLLPAVVGGALFGRALFVRIGQRAFDVAVVGLTAVGAVLLLR
jgi:uncharacterized protein